MSDIYIAITDDVDITRYLTYARQVMKEKCVITPDKRVVAKTDLDIVFPESYLEKKLCSFGEDISCLGIFAIVDPQAKQYVTFMIPAQVSLAVGDIRRWTYREEGYRIIRYRKGETMFNSTDVLSDDLLTYWLYDYFIALARVPWYLSYNQLMKLYDQDQHYAGLWLGKSSSVVEMILSNIARVPGNETQIYRQQLKTKEDLKKVKPVWVPLKNISMGSVDTFSKIMGAYYADGQASALAEPSKSIVGSEVVLRA